MGRFGPLYRRSVGGFRATRLLLYPPPAGASPIASQAALHSRRATFFARAPSAPTRDSHPAPVGAGLDRSPVAAAHMTEQILDEAVGSSGRLATTAGAAPASASPPQRPHHHPRSAAASTDDAFPAQDWARERAARGAPAVAAASSTLVWPAARVEAVLHRHRRWVAAAAAPYGRETAAAAVELSPDDREEIRQLVDHVTHLLHSGGAAVSPARQSAEWPHLRQWATEACRLAHGAGLHDRCCELFFAALDGRPAAAVEAVPEVVIRAATACRDVAALDRCLSIAEAVHAGHCSADAVGGGWVASPGVVQALRIYSGCVEIVNSAAAHGGHHRHTAAAALASRCEPLLFGGEAPQRGPAVGGSVDDRLTAAARRARYAAADYPTAGWSPDGTWALQSQAAVALFVFQRWCEGPAAGSGAAGWLTPHALHAVLRSAIQAQRWDAAALYGMYVDLHFFSGRAARMDDADDTLVGATLRYYLFSARHRHGLAWLAALQAAYPAYLPSVAVANVIARLTGAGGSSDPRRALQCLELLLDARQPAAPSAGELFACVCALAQCGIPNYPAIIDSLVDNGLLAPSEEELLYVKLLHCRGNIRWRPLLDDLLHGALGPSTVTGEAAPESPGLTADPARVQQLCTPRVVHAVLLVMHEGEHPLLPAYYRFFLLRAGHQVGAAERARWALFAVGWATSRCGRVADDDLLFIAREVGQLLRLSQGTGGAVIPAPVRHSLVSKWAALYAQRDEGWWRGHSRKRDEGRARRGRGAAAAAASVIVPPTVASGSLFPVARFLKRRTHVQLSTAPSAQLLGTLLSVGVDDGRMGTEVLCSWVRECASWTGDDSH